MDAGPDRFKPEDLTLLEQIGEAIVKRRMATPALFFLESLGPLNFLGSQVLHGLRPILEAACSGVELERVAQILESRESIPVLIGMIERKAQEKTAK